MCRVYISDEDVSYWEDNEVEPLISIDSMRDVVVIFINGQLAGSYLSYYHFCWIKLLMKSCYYCMIVIDMQFDLISLF